jgi:hypothetical protein
MAVLSRLLRIFFYMLLLLIMNMFWQKPTHGRMGAARIGMPQQRLNRKEMVRTA